MNRTPSNPNPSEAPGATNNSNDTVESIIQSAVAEGFAELHFVPVKSVDLTKAIAQGKADFSLTYVPTFVVAAMMGLLAIGDVVAIYATVSSSRQTPCRRP